MVRRRTEIGREATISLFREFEAAGIHRGRPPSGWEEAREVTSILVDATTPKDGYTAEHATEVARLSRLVGKDLGLGGEELEWLVHGAFLHDLGKLGVADEILRKPGTLTEEEWAAVKRHPQIGARMIEPIGPLLGAVPVVRHHHERPDGTGYPDGLEGEEILCPRAWSRRRTPTRSCFGAGHTDRGFRSREPSRNSRAEQEASSMRG